MCGPIVSTTNGRVRGRWQSDVAVFRGIPYACPPVHALRFRAPQPAKEWCGELQATGFGSAVPQSGPVRAPKYHDFDWLTLNVWTVPHAGDEAPVLVWIHGGAYMAGSSSDPMYDAATLARSGVVVVSINYRVGVEGFVQIRDAPANRGLLDQVEALRWVQDNIGAFGGDPGRVTVCGQSAGAGSIAALMCMPMTRGLFKRAIAQSVPGMYCTAELAAEIAQWLAERSSAEPTVADLGLIDPQKLADKADQLTAELPERAPRWGRMTRLSALFCPVVDGETLPAVPWSPRAPRHSDVDLLIGHTRDEFRLFMPMLGDGPVTLEMVDETIRAHVPGHNPVVKYRDAFPGSSERELFEIVHSDVLFRQPSFQTAQAHANSGGNTYMYEFCWDAIPTGLGACHSIDVPMLFGTHDSPSARLVLGDDTTEEAEAVGDAMRQAWVAFVAHGDPGWEPFTSDNWITRRIDAIPATGIYPEQASQRIWNGQIVDAFDLRCR